LVENLPTGGLLPVSGERDLRHGRVIGTTTLDDIWTDLPNPSAPAAAAGLIERAQLVSPTNHRLAVWTSRAFRELVLFTPPHRNAVAIEPYTCVTDAINLFYRGIDSGWQELLPGHSWRGTVEFRLTQPT
jgi:aldose 1-epimerase